MTFSQQLGILVETVLDTSGNSYSANFIASQTGMSQQTILNFLSGNWHNPRLDNLRALCHFFGISLAYFDCQTEVACRAYVAQKRLAKAPAIVEQIAAQSDQLSDKGKHNVLTVMQWIEAGLGVQLPNLS